MIAGRGSGSCRGRAAAIASLEGGAMKLSRAKDTRTTTQQLRRRKGNPKTENEPRTMQMLRFAGDGEGRRVGGGMGVGVAVGGCEYA